MIGGDIYIYIHRFDRDMEGGLSVWIKKLFPRWGRESHQKTKKLIRERGNIYREGGMGV